MAAMALSTWEQFEDPPGQRMELAFGQVTLNPAPRFIRQQAVRVLTNALIDACGPEYLAAFDGEWRIRSADSDSLIHARRPDVVVARASAIRGSAALWDAPLVVVEVLSPGNRKPEIVEKRSLYFEYGAAYYVEVTISDDEQEATIRWYGRGPAGWVETGTARGEETLEIRQPFNLAIRPNELLF